MVRFVIFLVLVVFFSGAITILADSDSRIQGQAFNHYFDISSGFLIAALFLLVLGSVYITLLAKRIGAIPGRLRTRRQNAKHDRGLAALTRGLEAVAAGDRHAAAQHTQTARRDLGNTDLVRLLTAQSAQLNGDTAMATDSYAAMLENPETEFLGLKGLYAQAMTEGNPIAALHHAERAFRLRRDSGWAFEAVFSHGLENGTWSCVRDAVKRARESGILDAPEADRATAVLYTADAYTARDGGDTKQAFRELKQACALVPGFTPAVLLEALMLDDAGRKRKAAAVIRKAFSLKPDPALVKFYNSIYEDIPDTKSIRHLRRLADVNPQCTEAALPRAYAYCLEGEWKQAVMTLKPLLEEMPDASVFFLMEKAVTGLLGKEAARPWAQRALAAPHDPLTDEKGRFHPSRKGWSRMVREYMDYERLAPPLLAQDAVSVNLADEVAALLSMQPGDSSGHGKNTVNAAVAARAEPESVRKPPDSTRPEKSPPGNTGRQEDTTMGRMAAAAGRVS